MRKQHALAMIRRALYSVKRQYPTRAVIHRRSAQTLNLETGAKSATITAWEIERAVMLQADTSRKFVYDLAFIASNKNFTYGGHFDTKRRRLIVDYADLPAGFEPKKDDYIIAEGRRYEIDNIEEFEYRAAIVYTMIRLEGSENIGVYEEDIRSTLHIGQTVVATLN